MRRTIPRHDAHILATRSGARQQSLPSVPIILPQWVLDAGRTILHALRVRGAKGCGFSLIYRWE